MVGHAAVFNRWSLDLGGFRERIKKGAFDEVLSRDPHVVHVIDHDTAKILASTRSKSLDLSIDPKGLRYWSKVAPTSYANDLRILLERGDISSRRSRSPSQKTSG
jgi:HK97 family phage prohead protease